MQLLDFNQFIHNKIMKMDVNKLKEDIGNRKCILWGYDDKAIQLKDCLEKKGIHIEGICDNSDALREKHPEVDIKKPSEYIYESSSKDYYIVVSLWLNHVNAIIKLILENGYTREDYFYPAKEWMPEYKELRIRQGENIAAMFPEDKHYILLGGAHIGEEVQILSWLYAYKKEHDVKSVNIITNKQYEGIAHLFYEDVDSVIGLEKIEVQLLREYVNSYRKKHYNILAPQFRWPEKDKMVLVSPTMIECKTIDLGLPYSTKSKYISGYGITNDKVRGIIEKYNIPEGKAIILAPYAQSTKLLTQEFWKMLVEKWDKEYTFYTNALDHEDIIEGTSRLNVSLEYMIDIVNYAGYAISLRSGLADLLAIGQCNCAVIYPINDIYEEIWTNKAKLPINEEESILYQNAVELYPNSAKEQIIKNIEKILFEKRG